MVDFHDASPLTPPSQLVAHLKARYADEAPHAVARLSAALAGGALLVPAGEWHAGQPAIPLRATRAADGGTVLHTFTDLAALRAALGSSAWAAYPFPTLLEIARDQGCEAVVINEAGPWAAVLDVAGLAPTPTLPQATEGDLPEVPDRRDVEALRERSAELRRVAGDRRASGARDAARAALADAIALHEEIGDLLNLAFGLNDLGGLDCLLGAPDLAAEELGRSRELFQRLRNRQGAALVEANLGWLALAGGDRAAALDRAAAALSVDTEPAYRKGAISLAEALAASHEDLEGAVAAARLAGRAGLLVAALSARGQEALRADRLDAAAADFAESAGEATRSGEPLLLARAQIDLAWLDARLGDVAAARAGAERARAIDQGPETAAAVAELLRQVEQMERLLGVAAPARNGTTSEMSGGRT